MGRACIFETRAPQLAKALSIAVAGRMQKSRAQSMTWNVEGKGAASEMATSDFRFSYWKCKRTLKGVSMRFVRTYSSRGPDRTLRKPH